MLGFPRLVLFPLLAWILTGPEFGDFIIALSVMQMIGAAPTNGVTGYVLRDAANHSPSDQTLILRTALISSAALMFTIGLIIAAANPWIAGLWPGSNVAELLPLMAIWLVCQNLAQVAMAVWRVRRQFARLVIARAAEATMLFSAIPLYHLVGMRGVAIGFALGGLAALATIFYIERATFLGGGRWFDWRFVRGILRVWAPLSISALIYLSSGYLDRLVLGAYWPTSESTQVAAFFVATSIARVFLTPANQASALLLSLLGRVRSSDRFGRRFYIAYAVGLLAVNGLLIVVGMLLGPFALRLLYSETASEAQKLWGWAIVAMSLLSLQVGSRPFVTKFLPPVVIPILTAVMVISRVVPIVLLVPSGGALGAAHALLIGSAISSACWFGLFLKSFVFSGVARDSVIVRPGESSSAAGLDRSNGDLE